MYQNIYSGTDDSTDLTSTKYNVLQCAGTQWYATEAYRRQIISTSGTLKNLRVRLNSTANGGDWEFTVMKNGVATSLKATVLFGTQTASDTTNTVLVSSGDEVSLRCVPIDTPNEEREVHWNVQFDGDNVKESIVLGSSGTNLPSTTSTTYNYINGSNSFNISEVNRKQLIADSCTMKNLYVKLDGSPGTSKNYVFTLMKNGVATGLTVTISDSSTTNNDTTNTASFSPGDEVSLRCVPNGTPTARRARWGITCVTTTDGNSNVFGGSDSSATNNYYQSISRSGGVYDISEEDRLVVGQSAVLKNFYMKLSTAPGAGNSQTFTLRKNNVNTSLSITISDTDTSGNDLTNQITISDGDILSIKNTQSGSPASSLAHYWGFVSRISEPLFKELIETISFSGSLNKKPTKLFSNILSTNGEFTKEGDFFRTFIINASLLDAHSLKITKGFEETFTLSDNILTLLIRNILETFVLSSAHNFDLKRYLNENVNISDFNTKKTIRNFIDNIVFTPENYKRVNKDFLVNLNIQDGKLFNANKKLNENLNLSDGDIKNIARQFITGTNLSGINYFFFDKFLSSSFNLYEEIIKYSQMKLSTQFNLVDNKEFILFRILNEFLNLSPDDFNEDNSFFIAALLAALTLINVGKSQRNSPCER